MQAGLQVEKPNLDMQLTPVTVPIKSKMKKERNTKINPSRAYVRVFLALSTLFGSPPEFINLKPEKIIIKREIIPAKVKSH